MTTEATETRKLLVSPEEAEKYQDQLTQIERLLTVREADLAGYEQRVQELEQAEGSLSARPFFTGDSASRDDLVATRGRMNVAANAVESLRVERDAMRLFIERHVYAPPEPEPEPVDELTELEAARQALAYDAAQGDQAAAKKLAEVEGRISSIRLERERAVLVAAEAARREAEAERERQAAERAAQEARCAQLEAALRECYLAVERATDQLISAVQQAIEPWIELDTLRAQLGRPRERWIKHRLHDRIARRLNVEAGLTWFELGDPVLAPPLAEPDPPKPAFEAEQPDQPDQPEEPDDLPPAA